MSKEHTLLCIVGKTASGKDFLVTQLCMRRGLRQLISYTTRERRVDEDNTHIFISDKEYDVLEAGGRIAAFTKIGKYRYCCTVDQLYDNDLYIVDYEGLQNLRKLNLPNLRLVTVFINTPDDIREERALKKRKDDKTKFRARSLAERDQFREMLRKADFDYSVNNVDWMKAYSVLHWIATVEGVYKNQMEGEEQ